MRKIIITGMTLFYLLLIGFSAGTPEAMASPKAAWEKKWDKLLEAGKKEGKVVIYGHAAPSVRKALRTAFTPKYGIELEFLNIPRGGELAARLKKERTSGLYLADVAIKGPTTMTVLLKRAGILDPMEPVLILPEVKDPTVWRKNLYFIDKDRMIKPLRCSYTRFIMRNTNLVKEDEIKSYRDLLGPKWKGKMVMYDPTGPGTGSAFVASLYGLWGEEKTVEFLEQLVKQELVLTKDYRLPVEWVARGKYPIGIGMRAEVLPDFLKLGAAVAIQRVQEGSLLAPGAGIVAIVNKRPHPNATAVFINWLLSKEGLTAFSKGDGYGSARVDVSTDWVNPMFLEIPGEKVVVEDEAVYKKHRSYMKRSKKIFAPLLKKMKKKKK